MYFLIGLYPGDEPVHFDGKKGLHLFFCRNPPLQDHLRVFAGQVAKTFSGPSNFKGLVIKEALVVFRDIEKQGSAQGIPIRTPSPSVA